mmetsp:Transcript_7042/g.13280  ORF Transcript_7042/g.13280 Transcript_7042/m.13280 type:complete len:90 (-) Transcript_7042:1653-1922(-)
MQHLFHPEYFERKNESMFFIRMLAGNMQVSTDVAVTIHGQLLAKRNEVSGTSINSISQWMLASVRYRVDSLNCWVAMVRCRTRSANQEG